MKRKYIIGIGVLVVLLCLTLVMCGIFHGIGKNGYEGEKVPIETTEDIFDDGEEDNTSQNNTKESGNGESDANVTSNDESILGENGVEVSNTNEGNKDVSDKENEQENGKNLIDEGWGPFY